MSDQKKNYRHKTKLVHMGRDPSDYHGIVNPPIARASTILYPSLEAYDDPSHKYRYANLENPLSDHFEAAMAELEGGAGAVSMQTGKAAFTVPLFAFLNPGDHLLMVDCVYEPTRIFCHTTLERFGVEVEYYDPLIGAGIKDLIKDNTRVIYMESPCSGTFEVQDVPAIVAEAKKRGVITMIDNTWSAGVLFKPLEHGVNISLQAATKYIGGHSDVNLGFVVADTNERVKAIRQCSWELGMMAGQDDMYLSLRGLRSMELRLEQCADNAYEVASWMREREEVQRVYYPPFEDSPGHDIWKRDFSGANGIFSFLLQPSSKEAVYAFAGALKLFPVGSSWGGYESLLQPQYPERRTATKWTHEGKLLRFQIGLEDPKDLIEDIENGFKSFNVAR